MWYNVLIMAEQEPQVAPPVDYAAERRAEVAEGQGIYNPAMADAAITGVWSPPQSGYEVPAPEPEPGRASSPTPRSPRRFGPSRDFTHDSHVDPYWNGGAEMDEAKPEGIAGPDSPGRLATRAIVRNSEWRGLERRANGDPLMLRALRRKYLDAHPGWQPDDEDVA
jgi:hypothetical protein